MELKSEEKIWYAYETEVFNKLPDLRKTKKIPMKLMKRIRKRWVSVEDVLKWLTEKEEAAKDRFATGDAFTYKELRKEVEDALCCSLSEKLT